jgi:hypothetical protein
LVHLPNLDKAVKYLATRRGADYLDVETDQLLAIYRPYACRLGADGMFACCTWNLFACGGLRGKLCKHILIVVIDAVRRGQLSPQLALDWVKLSGKHKPIHDKARAAAIFLRYRGDGNQVDWRPAERIPEDDYAV